ncbi:MAG: hypothetical protein DWQ19_08975 [Crenarchaeota archaeon]|nr:MAG: hypothetical protein DWQ19_08975 [Thermoproteota archaeon]
MDEPQKIYYKVLIKENEKLQSVCKIVKDINDWVLEYKLNEWITAKPPTKLFVFDSLEHASNLVDELTTCLATAPSVKVVIYECETIQPQPLKHMATLHDQAINSFWRNHRLTGYCGIRLATPKHTYGCNSLKLIKPIHNEILQSC